MQLTSNLNLKKPQGTDVVDIADLNANADILDTEVTKLASASAPGRMSAADKTKLDGVAAGANNYVHPSGDGNQHVPATGTSNNGKVLKAGATAGSAGWGTVSGSEIIQDANNRFVSDSDKAAWNAKANASEISALSLKIRMGAM